MADTLGGRIDYTPFKTRDYSYKGKMITRDEYEMMILWEQWWKAKLAQEQRRLDIDEFRRL